MYSRALIVASVLAGVACSSGVSIPDTGSDIDGLAPLQCDVDSSNQVSQAWSATLGEAATQTICPRADRDYWKISGAGGPSQLLNVDITYSKLSAIELETEVYGPRGRCMDNAITACTASTDCPSDKPVCDTARGGCRTADASVCFSNVECPGQQCYGATTAIELVGNTRIAATSALLHRLNANFPAFQTGEYTIGVYDHAETEEDAEVTYALTVTQQTDTDANEPNDRENQATAIADGEDTNGAMSYVGDVDYFVVTPTTTGQPAVILIDLSYAASSSIAPTWSISQGTFEYLGPDTVVEGSGADAIRRQKTAVVTPSSDPIYIRVENASLSTNTTDTYNLAVRVGIDTTEGNNRNDLIANATELNAGSPSSSSFYNQNDRSLVAANDIDWYRVPKSGTGNTLLHVLNNAAIEAPYSLVVQIYRATTTTCDETTACAQGRPCSKEGFCLDLLAQRPSPDGPGDPQLGGLVQNYQETQLPFFESPYYVRVVHDAATRLPVDGYDFDETYRYHLQMDHRAEPDSGDSGTPDNTFVSRPLTASLSDFNPVYRKTGFTSSVSAPSGGTAIAVIPSSRITANACVAQTISAFNNLGVAFGTADTTTLAISATNATVYSDSGCSVAAPTSMTGPTLGVWVRATADATISIAANGGTAVSSYIATTAGQGVTFVAAVATSPIGRGIAANTATNVFQVRLPSASSGETTLTISAENGGGVQCTSTTGSGASLKCVNDDGTDPSYCSPTTFLGSCNIKYLSSGQNYNMRARFPTAGVGYVSVERSAQAERYQWSVYNGGRATGSNITGYISYDGDQDFFQIDPPATGLGPGGMTITLHYDASQVDIRASILRGSRSVGVGYGGDDDIQESCDTCSGNAAVPFSCNASRQTCVMTTVDLSAGPEASTASCGASNATGTAPIYIWVNEKSSNDWDTTAQYQIDVSYREGCPTVCSADDCN